MFTERPSKRLRSNTPPTPHDGRDCYLDTIPGDSLRTVLRFLSRRPQHYNWHPYISPLSVNIALDVGGALARAASLEFCCVGGKDGVPVRTVLNKSIFRPLFHRLHLHRLVLKLDGDQVLPDLLRGCGAELREIVLYAWGTVVTKTDILAISTHCPNLSSLAIHGNRFGGMLTPIWRSLGSTLTRIYIGCYYRYSGFRYRTLSVLSVPDLVEHCVNLRRVDVGKLNDAFADVLIALGSRIRVLSVEDGYISNISQWRKVYEACTSLEAVHLTLYNICAHPMDILALMRTKVVSLSLDMLPTLMPTGDRLFSLFPACSSLKEVEFGALALDTETLQKLFQSLKSVTSIKCAVDRSDVDAAKDIIDIVACNLRNLESLTMSTPEPLNGEDVNALVNLSHLKSVKLRHACFYVSVTRHPERCAVEVVERLKDCAQLVELDIDDHYMKTRSQLIAKAAVMYGREDFDMFIGGVQYRTW